MRNTNLFSSPKKVSERCQKEMHLHTGTIYFVLVIGVEGTSPNPQFPSFPPFSLPGEQSHYNWAYSIPTVAPHFSDTRKGQWGWGGREKWGWTSGEQERSETQKEKSKRKSRGKTRKRGAKVEVTKAVHTQDPDPTATSPEDSGDIKTIQYVTGTEAAKNV